MMTPAESMSELEKIVAESRAFADLVRSMTPQQRAENAVAIIAVRRSIRSLIAILESDLADYERRTRGDAS